MEALLVRETLRSIRQDWKELVYSCTYTLGAIRMDHEADEPHLQVPRWAALRDGSSGTNMIARQP
jgi:hypothetical protein